MKYIFRQKISWLDILLILLIVASIFFISILASVPPVSRDALTHHLAIPKLYLEHGGIYEIPHLGFSYYPMNLDLLYIIPLYFNNDIIPKFIHFAFALITAAMIYRYLYRRINRSYALLGSLFFLTIPIIVRLSSTVYVDLGLICFFFASLLYLFDWIESGFMLRYLLISAVFCGLALGTKYNGLLGLFLLGLFIPFIYSRYHVGQKSYYAKAVGCGTLFVMVALIIFSPWMIRNFYWTANPVYPLYNSFFNKKPMSAEANLETIFEKRVRMSHIQIRHQVYGESWLEIAMIPLRVFFQGRDDDPKFFDGKNNPFLLLLSVFAFFGIRSTNRQEKTEKMMMMFFSMLFLLYACSNTAIRIRYFSPILPPLVILSIFGIYNIKIIIMDNAPQLSELFKKIIIFSIVFVMISLNVMYIADRLRKDQAFVYVLGKASRDQYIQAYRPEYAAFQYANKNLAKDQKILGLYIGNRGYYSDIPIEFNISILQQYATKANSGQDIAAKLYDKGFTHLLIYFSLFNQWVETYSTHEKIMLKDFFEKCTITKFSKDGYGLLSLNNCE